MKEKYILDKEGHIRAIVCYSEGKSTVNPSIWNAEIKKYNNKIKEIKNDSKKNVSEE